MSTLMTEVDLALLKKSLVEVCVPMHMLHLAAESVRMAGYELRPDMLMRLNRGAAAPLAALGNDQMSIRECATNINNLAISLLNNLAPDNMVHALYCTAMFQLVLVDELLLDDSKSVGNMLSLLLIDDIRLAGNSEGYVFNAPLLKAEAHKMLFAARRLGYYSIELKDLVRLEAPKEESVH